MNKKFKIIFLFIISCMYLLIFSSSEIFAKDITHRTIIKHDYSDDTDIMLFRKFVKIADVSGIVDSNFKILNLSVLQGNLKKNIPAGTYNSIGLVFHKNYGTTYYDPVEYNRTTDERMLDLFHDEGEAVPIDPNTIATGDPAAQADYAQYEILSKIWGKTAVLNITKSHLNGYIIRKDPIAYFKR